MKYPYTKDDVTADEIELALACSDGDENNVTENYILHIAGCVIENIVDSNAEACCQHRAPKSMDAEEVARQMHFELDGQTDFWEGVDTNEEASAKRKLVADQVIVALEFFWCGNFAGLDAITHPLTFLRENRAKCPDCHSECFQRAETEGFRWAGIGDTGMPSDSEYKKRVEISCTRCGHVVYDSHDS